MCEVYALDYEKTSQVLEAKTGDLTGAFFKTGLLAERIFTSIFLLITCKTVILG